MKVKPEDISDEFAQRKGMEPLRAGTTLYQLLKRPILSYADLKAFDPHRPGLDGEITEQVQIEIKYEDYIKKQEEQIQRFLKTENRLIPEDFDYTSALNLRLEARQKLSKLRPKNIGQASRISGVSPADISVLMVECAKYQSKGK